MSETSAAAAMPPDPGTGPGFSTELLEQLKEHLPEALFASLRGTVATYEKQLDSTRGELDSTRGELQYAQQKIQVLEEHLRRRRIAKYGPGSETLSDLQLQLLEEEPGVSRQEVAAESEREALPPSQEEQKRQRRPHPGRQTLPAHLPRVEKIIACRPEQCVCGKCGGETSVIGYETSEVLKVKPAEYYVEVSKREKRACKQKQCEEQGVKAAPLPTRIIDKSLVSDEIIIDTIVSKYADHTPLYRQSVILLRDAGVEISRATMCGWVMTVGEMLQPVVSAMRQELLAGSYIQADETPVDVQMHDKRGKNHQAYLWQYGIPGGGAVFDFRMSRGRAGPAQFLGNFEGILQTDDYIAYERGIGGPKMVHACCWSHARRQFVDAVKLNRQDAASISAVELLDALFAIDREAREEKMDQACRDRLRQEKARPLLEKIQQHLLATSKTVLPKSAVGAACSYTLALWKKLTCFLEHPQLELSNNLAENSMRPVATGRKNWIHIGSQQAGPHAAAILSVVESCRRLKLPVRDYLAKILPGLADTSIKRVAELTPAARAARHTPDNL
ncbi:MAG TPA: IS66 family transposase [Terracidiphilus sp.]